MNKRDALASLVLLGISAFFWVQTRSFSKFGSLFPQTVIIILGFLSLLLLIISIIKIIKSDTRGSKVEKIQDVRSIIISTVIIIAWAFSISILGFLTSSIIFFIAMYLFFIKKGTRLKKLAINIVTILTSIIVFYLFFLSILHVPFPTGIFL